MKNIQNICIVGLGRQGNVHLEAAIELQKMGLIKAVYAYDLDEGYLENMQQIFNFSKLESLKKLVSDSMLYVLCAPNNVHDEIIREIYKYNPTATILKEKPLYNNKEVDVGSQKVNIAQQRFFNDSYSYASNSLEIIGKIKYFDYQYTLNDNKESWYWDNDRGGGCFLNVGWHFVFLMLWFFGSPESFLVNKMKTGRKSFEYNTDDTTFIDVKYKDFFGKVYMSVADSSKRDSFRIIGEKGTLEVNKKECIIYGIDGGILKKKDGNELLSYMKQLWAVCSEKTELLNKLKTINIDTNNFIKNN